MPLRPAEDVLVAMVDGEAVLLQADSGQYFRLNEVGARVWELLVDHGDIGSVQAVLEAEFDVEAARLRADIETLVRDLRDNGLVVTDER